MVYCLDPKKPKHLAERIIILAKKAAW